MNCVELLGFSAARAMKRRGVCVYLAMRELTDRGNSLPSEI
jgi:hypothetical protein